MARALPPVTGKQLIALLVRDGWREIRQSGHGVALAKQGTAGRVLVTIVPDKNQPLPPGTLSAILGPRQSGIRELHALGYPSLRVKSEELRVKS